MKLKKHIKTKLTITAIAIAFVGGATVGQKTPTASEKAFNYQVTLLENENNRIYSINNDMKVSPESYQNQEVKRLDKFISKHKLNHRQIVILESMVNNNTNSYLETWYTNH
ncbi:hypothetical protein LW4_041 [Lactococcus phage LW4]|uniref:Uncharacterized protein n=4 Tax=Teubervirus LW31 TaxID=2845420 RepID=A0A1W6JHZ5_9CAUD|nr:hypothetical protein H1N70_gp39 [Lactococcus phage LW31]ARM65641.1 hypothetical protein LW31_039 [Lactococcus phage LW31]ARM65729.1 hypothetical protein LW32_042 [Lactococcus phage LW32]ARM65815.1 hypothetical protein LW33_041 [Lactococcus phage LW33]ARM65901.1 hypothetical protein LW4_041 [Lactococcus phage LW4]